MQHARKFAILATCLAAILGASTAHSQTAPAWHEQARCAGFYKALEILSNRANQAKQALSALEVFNDFASSAREAAIAARVDLGHMVDEMERASMFAGQEFMASPERGAAQMQFQSDYCVGVMQRKIAAGREVIFRSCMMDHGKAAAGPLGAEVERQCRRMASGE